MSPHRVLICVFIIGFYHPHVISQDDCLSAPYARMLGSTGNEEKGYSLAFSPIEEVIYMGALKSDSVVIIKIKPSGDIVWSRTLDVIPGRADHVGKIIVDSEGMIAIAGIGGSHDTGGDIFAFRYDPFTNTILWAKQIVSIGTGSSPGLQEIGPGGDYLVSNNVISPVNNQEIYKLNRNTGDIIPACSKRYDLGSSETLGDILFHNGMLYATGRFTDGDGFPKMRTTLMKFDPADGTPVWTILGHRPISEDARLYGVDMVIDQEEIFSISVGDPSGTSIDFTQLFVQKTSLDGEVAWVKQYNLPGTNDWADEIISSDNGIVILARNRVSPSDIILFKIDRDGNILWSRKFDFSVNDNSISIGYVFSQMMAFQEHIYFTAFAEINSSFDILLVKTNLQGEINDACVETASLDIQVIPVPNPIFYTVQPTVTDYIPDLANLSLDIVTASPLATNSICYEENSVTETFSATICQGELFEGYNESGTYMDTFLLDSGCDSIRTLILNVIVCEPPGCQDFSGAFYGEPFIEEQGRCLVKSSISDVIYVAGNRDDSTLLIKLDFNGQILWTKIIDVVPGTFEAPAGILEDADGMVAVVGTAGVYEQGGTLYGIRFDPETQSVLWAKEYSHSPNNYSYGMTEKGPGGNYLINNQPTFFADNYNNAELLEIDKLTGNVIPAFSKNYNLTGTESLYEVTYHDHYVYGVGRYKDAGASLQMRNTLVKIDPDNGDQLWVRMGHLAVNNSARLYGTDLVIAYNSIYSIYFGNPIGQSIALTKLYIQRTDFDGNLLWVKQYELPGVADFSLDLIASGNGFVALTYDNRTKDCYLFKVDTLGEVVWAKHFLTDGITLVGEGERANSVLIEAGNQLFFTGYGTNETGDADLVLIRTDMNGELQSLCISNETITIQAQPVGNPVFYAKTPEAFLVEVSVTDQTPGIGEMILRPTAACLPEAITTTIEATICAGEQYESYSETGMYQDTFLTSEGCDSIRILELTVLDEIVNNPLVEICLGDTYEGKSVSGLYIDTMQAISGCDSIVRLQLDVVPVEQELFVEICHGQFFEQYDLPGIYIDTLQGITSLCDTIRNLTLSISLPIAVSIIENICEGESNFGHTAPGTYTDTLVSVAGCDSIRTVVLKGATTYIPNIFSPNDDGLNDLFEIKSFPDTGLDLHYFAIFDRFGNMAYQTETWPVSWSGKNKAGDPFSPAVFAYVLIYLCGEQKIVEHGNITLVR